MNQLKEMLQELQVKSTASKHTAALLATSLVMEQPTAVIAVDLKVVVVTADADVGTPFEEREKAATDRGTVLAEQVTAVVNEFKAKLNELGVNTNVEFTGHVAAAAAVFAGPEQRATFEADHDEVLAVMRDEAGTLKA